MTIAESATLVFFTNVIFIGARTWNIQAVAQRNITALLISGTVVHLSWLVSIAIGAVSMHEIMTEFRIEYVPIVACSLAGGLIGSVIPMVRKGKK
mgnify:CR=1 FL=1